MAAAPDNGEDESEDEWQFSLEDLEDETNDTAEGNVAGSIAADEPLTPGEIDIENAIFVVLGVLFVVGFLATALMGL